MSVGDGELSSMVAGLTVGKPGGTFSIGADSVLGRSSVITGTTIGCNCAHNNIVNQDPEI